MTALSQIKLFATHPHECSYLPEQEATTVFIDPEEVIDKELYQHLSTLGFRRSGSHVYRPNCENCNACVPVRIPVDLFLPNRRQKRCARINQDIDIQEVDSASSDEHYELYERYITTRHKDGDMYPPSREQFSGFLTSEWGLTRFFEMRLHKKLVGVMVCDLLNDGLSAVYTYFDPEYPKRSLGVFGILSQIQQAQTFSLKYLYLGYWIKESQKMSYKSEYRPLELLIEKRWRLLL
ncbi:MAG: arginyltransferase [Cellvibrionaceae bacterium]